MDDKYAKFSTAEILCLITAMRLYHGHRSLSEDEAEPALTIVDGAEYEYRRRTGKWYTG